tara:strand:- start:1859 stop:2188 length:330 start_codon:yes stop_codon:yes gene_type:complete
MDGVTLLTRFYFFCLQTSIVTHIDPKTKKTKAKKISKPHFNKKKTMTSSIPSGGLHEIMLVVVAEASWLLETNSFVLLQLHSNPQPFLVRRLLPAAISKYIQRIQASSR